ncbi:hypothetical protein AAG906_024216 [Vitis piasezkii]
MKDLGEVKVILGIKITRTPNVLKLSQEHYVEKIIRKFEHFDCKPVSTPYDPNSQLEKNKEHSVAQIEYAQIIGILIYLMNYTRPDIAYAVGFSNVNWISDSDEMKSTSRYVFILGGSAVSWKSAKRTCITRFTMETEFIVLEKTSSKAEWFRNLLVDISLWTRPTPSMSMRVISLDFVRSKLNLADPLTKPLNKKLVEETSRGMGLMPITEVKSCGNPTY